MKILLFVLLFTSWYATAAKKDLISLYLTERASIQKAFESKDQKTLSKLLKNFAKKMKLEAKGLKFAYIQTKDRYLFRLAHSGSCTIIHPDDSI